MFKFPKVSGLTIQYRIRFDFIVISDFSLVLQIMSLGLVVQSTIFWLIIFEAFTRECESSHLNNRIRHKYKRQLTFSDEDDDNASVHQDDQPLRPDSSLSELNEDTGSEDDDPFELDEPRKCLLFYTIINSFSSSDRVKLTKDINRLIFVHSLGGFKIVIN